MGAEWRSRPRGMGSSSWNLVPVRGAGPLRCPPWTPPGLPPAFKPVLSPSSGLEWARGRRRLVSERTPAVGCSGSIHTVVEKRKTMEPSLRRPVCVSECVCEYCRDHDKLFQFSTGHLNISVFLSNKWSHKKLRGVCTRSPDHRWLLK